MSYSYINVVFPSFKSSTTDVKLFNNITPQPLSQLQEVELNNKGIELPQTKLIEEPTPLPQTSNFQQIETFETGDCNFDCKEYLKHITECSACKNMMIKQFNIDNDRIRTEETMELLSFIVFGVFILLLVDSLKRD